MVNLTLPEVLFLEEEMRASSALISFIEHASELAQDPRVKSLCNQMIQDHQRQSQAFSRFLGARLQ